MSTCSSRSSLDAGGVFRPRRAKSRPFLSLSRRDNVTKENLAVFSGAVASVPGEDRFAKPNQAICIVLRRIMAGALRCDPMKKALKYLHDNLGGVPSTRSMRL